MARVEEECGAGGRGVWRGRKRCVSRVEDEYGDVGRSLRHGRPRRVPRVYRASTAHGRRQLFAG